MLLMPPGLTRILSRLGSWYALMRLQCRATTGTGQVAAQDATCKHMLHVDRCFSGKLGRCRPVREMKHLGFPSQ